MRPQLKTPITMTTVHDTTEGTAMKESLGQLVQLGFDVTVFTPAAYPRPRLGRPSMEYSSRGWLRA